jgi:hypothetical protein
VTVAAIIASVAALTAILVQLLPVYLEGRLPNEEENDLGILLILIAVAATVAVCVLAVA